MLQARNIKEIRLIEFPELSDPCRRVRTSFRSEAGVIQAVVDYTDVVARHVEEPENITGCVAADGDDGVLALGKAARDYTRIEGAKRIIFIGNVKWSQIVNGRDQR